MRARRGYRPSNSFIFIGVTLLHPLSGIVAFRFYPRKLATDRFSVREFSPRPVEDEKIEKILEAAKVAPTAVNYQPQKIYLIKSQEAVKKLAGIRNIFGAPLAVIICYDETLSWKNGKDNGHDSGEVDAHHCR